MKISHEQMASQRHASGSLRTATLAEQNHH